VRAIGQAPARRADPAALRTAEKRAETLRELADLFLAEHAEAKRKGSTAAFYRDVLERLVLPELGNRKVEKVTTAELARLHTKMKAHPYQHTSPTGVPSSPCRRMKGICASENFDLFMVAPHPTARITHAAKLEFSSKDRPRKRGAGHSEGGWT
jgi:hypothetical protein